jgi:vancomycin aglycone glucosyltransferase
MRALLSTIGTRGEVQPLLGLARELVGRGHAATICAPPNFGPWVQGFGVGFVPIGPDTRTLPAPPDGPPPPLPPMEVRPGWSPGPCGPSSRRSARRRLGTT